MISYRLPHELEAIETQRSERRLPAMIKPERVSRVAVRTEEIKKRWRRQRGEPPVYLPRLATSQQREKRRSGWMGGRDELRRGAEWLLVLCEKNDAEKKAEKATSNLQKR